DNYFILCTWNVRLLYRCGATQDLLHILTDYKAEITAIQEIRWLGKVPSSPNSTSTKKHDVHQTEFSKTQSDHVLFDRTPQHSLNVLDLRSKRGADINSDHHLATACLLKTTTIGKSIEKVQYRVLKDPATARNFETYISEKLATIPTDLDIERPVLIEALSRCCGDGMHRPQ
uniref:Endonuclease/exonuclease/phosphatase domain-containing protein n=1 Tax=Megaselia scalaris TaxID=36166 RepID=T1GAT2_MEGSC